MISGTASLHGFVKVLRNMLPDLSRDPVLSFLVDCIRVVMVIVDREVFAILDELVQLTQGCLAAGLECIVNQYRP